jgi:hypothetical protein
MLLVCSVAFVVSLCDTTQWLLGVCVQQAPVCLQRIHVVSFCVGVQFVSALVGGWGALVAVNVFRRERVEHCRMPFGASHVVVI